MLIFWCALIITPKVTALFEVRAKSFIVSPAIAKANVSDTTRELPNFVDRSYFGFSLSVYKTTDGNLRLLVGAPKTLNSTNPAIQDDSDVPSRDPTGSIESCSITPSFFGDGQSDCSSANPPDLHPGDYFGLEVDSKDAGSITACAPARPQDCEDWHYTPGICFPSQNYGEDWNEPLKTRSKCPARYVEVLFVLDGSGSVGRDFDRVKTWVKNISKKIGIDEGFVSVGVVQYSHYFPDQDINNQSWIVTEMKIGEYNTSESFASAVDKIVLHGHTTYTGRALEKVLTDFQTTQYYSKLSSKQVMILLTDGIAKDKELVEANAQKIRDIGVLPFAVGVGRETDVNRTELQLIATGNPGDDTRVFMATNFDGLEEIARELEGEIGGLVLEGGTGEENGTGYNLEFGQLGLSIAYSKPRILKWGTATALLQNTIYMIFKSTWKTSLRKEMNKTGTVSTTGIEEMNPTINK